MKFIPFSILLLFLTPCNSPKSIAKSNKEEDNSKVKIVFTKSPCFGKCPVFTFTISGATKTATYEGKQNVKKIGTYTKPISNDSISMLIKGFESVHFFDLDDKNSAYIPDLPSIFITFSNNGKTKTVEESTNKPSPLNDLEKQLTEIANSDGWQKAEEKH